MYHALVRRLAKQNFLRVNKHDYEPLLKGCVPHISHRFAGNHALGGERHDRQAFRLWLQRLGRLCPTLKLTVRDIWVHGNLSRTTVIIRWTATQQMPDRSSYHNHGVHIIQMRWGKVTAIDANEDSQLVAQALQIIAAHGNVEAVAPPITS